MYACLLLVQESPCPVFIPSTASCAHFLRLFSLPSSCLLMVCLPFLLISLRVVCPGPSHSCTPHQTVNGLNFCKGGRGAGHPLLSSADFVFHSQSMSLLKHMASITGPLFPVSASFLLPTPCALWLLSLWAAEIQHPLHGPELMPPFLTLRGYEPSK